MMTLYLPELTSFHESVCNGFKAYTVQYKEHKFTWRVEDERKYTTEDLMRDTVRFLWYLMEEKQS